MDQVTQIKVLFRRVQWRKIIAECQVSGIPVKKLWVCPFRWILRIQQAFRNHPLWLLGLNYYYLVLKLPKLVS